MILFERTGLTVFPVEFSIAAEFINRHHRHCAAPVGHIFSLGCYMDGNLVGVAMCGRPVARRLDNGNNIEINRLCTDGTRNACSKLYSRCVRYAAAKGFKKVITYTLQSENGASLKASNFVLETDKAGGVSWTGKRKHKSTEIKRRWAFYISQ